MARARARCIDPETGKRLSQKGLARLSGVAEITISRMEVGQQVSRDTTIAAILDALPITPEERERLMDLYEEERSREPEAPASESAERSSATAQGAQARDEAEGLSARPRRRSARSAGTEHGQGEREAG